jgi:hypothetical protein
MVLLRKNIFGETFSLAPELQYEHLVATADVKKQSLKVLLGRAQVDETTSVLTKLMFVIDVVALII